MRILRHLAAIGLLPGMVTVLVPALLVSGDGLASWPLALLGAALIAPASVLMVRTVALFARVGDGTLAPWDPTSRLVVRGPYRHVRNPMISGVLCVLLGEAALFGSPALLAWWALFWRSTPSTSRSSRSPGCASASAPTTRPIAPRSRAGCRGCGLDRATAACPPYAPGGRPAWRAPR